MNLLQKSKNFTTKRKRDPEEVSIPADMEKLRVSIDRANLKGDPTRVIDVKCDLSLDNGQTWDFFFGFTTTGEYIAPEKRSDHKESWVKFPIPDKGNPNRKARIHIENFEKFETILRIDDGSST